MTDLNEQANIAAFSRLRTSFLCGIWCMFEWAVQKEGEERDSLRQTHGRTETPTDKSSIDGSSWNANGCLGIALGLSANEAHWSDRWGFNSEKELNYRPGKHQLGSVTLSPFIWARHPPFQLFFCLTCHLSLPLFRHHVLSQQSVNLLFPPTINPSSVFSPKNALSWLASFSFLTLNRQVVNLHLSST